MIIAMSIRWQHVHFEPWPWRSKCIHKRHISCLLWPRYENKQLLPVGPMKAEMALFADSSVTSWWELQYPRAVFGATTSVHARLGRGPRRRMNPLHGETLPVARPGPQSRQGPGLATIHPHSTPTDLRGEGVARLGCLSLSLMSVI